MLENIEKLRQFSRKTNKLILFCFNSKIIGEHLDGVDGQIIFDKATYHPGEIVNVTFSGIEPTHQRLNKIELFVYAYEEIKVTYQSGKNTHTARERIDYATTSTSLELSQAGGTHKLQLQLPEEMPSTFVYNGNWLGIEVVLLAEIKYDISMRTDEHVFSNAQVQAPPHHQPQPIDIEYKGLRITLADNLLTAGQEITIGVDPRSDFDTSYRSIRVEVMEYFQGTAQSRTKSTNNKWKIGEYEQLPSNRSLSFQLPNHIYQSNSGSNFVINHKIKVVVDRKMASDDNFELPIYYTGYDGVYQEPEKLLEAKTEKKMTIPSDPMYADFSSDEITCKNCGNAVSISEKKCPKCGARV